MSEYDYTVLSADELREVLRARRDRALSCSDGMCGGCPRCEPSIDHDEPSS